MVPSMDSRNGGPVFVSSLVNRLLNKHAIPNKILTLDANQVERSSDFLEFKRAFKLWDFSLDFLCNAHKEIRSCEVVLVHGIYSFLTLWVCVLSIFYNTKVFLRPAGMLDFDSITSGGLKKTVLRVMYLSLTAGFIYIASCKIIFNSSKEAGNSLFGGSKKAQVLPNGVDPSQISAIKTSKFYSKKIKVFFLGRLDAIKGIELVVDAFSELEDDIAGKIELFVAGDGNETFVSRLKQRSGENIKFLGALRR